MSSSSTRWSVLSALAAWVQFLPCPKSPWQKTTRDPAVPSSVRCRLTGPSSRTGDRRRRSGGDDLAVTGRVDEAVAGGERQGAVKPVLLPPPAADDLAELLGRAGTL